MAYSIDSTVNDLLANPAAVAIVEKHLPGLSSHPQIGMAGGMSLAVVAQFAAGLISPQALDKINAELKSLA